MHNSISIDQDEATISEATDADWLAWDDFVESSVHATCFHWYGWRIPLRDVLKYRTHFLIAKSNGRIIGIFPLAVVKSKIFGISASALPFCTYGGPIANSELIEAKLWNFAQTIANVNECRLETRLIRPSTRQLPTLDLYFSFKRELPRDVASMAWLPSKRRNMVRRGTAQGLSFDVSNDIERFFHLYAENAHTHGTPALPKAYFAALEKSLKGKLDILFVYNSDKKPISCIMNFYKSGEIHAGFAGELAEARKVSANDFKYWSLVEHAVTNKACTIFDFGRSKKGTGSFEFKRLWGFTPEPLFYEFSLQKGQGLPSSNPSNPKYQFVMNIWRRLPRFVVDRIGPIVIHGLG